MHVGYVLQGSIPPDWGSPGSFPVLQRANLGGNQLHGTLPQMQNGAMCALEVRMLRLIWAPLCTAESGASCCRRVTGLVLRRGSR
jgi:hypothetical protein